MPPSWPLLAGGIVRLSDGLVAEAGTGPVGFVALDMAGSIPLILVAPAYQRRGIGTALLARASEILREAGTATAISAGQPANPSTVTLATSPGDDMPCSPALPNRLRLPSTISPDSSICRHSAHATATTAGSRSYPPVSRRSGVRIA